jgi:hypothetical protein
MRGRTFPRKETRESDSMASDLGGTQHLLSVLVPLYNEEEYVGTSIERVLNAALPEGLSFRTGKVERLCVRREDCGRKAGTLFCVRPYAVPCGKKWKRDGIMGVNTLIAAKTERLEARLTDEQKDLFQHAADRSARRSRAARHGLCPRERASELPA